MYKIGGLNLKMEFRNYKIFYKLVIYILQGFLGKLNFKLEGIFATFFI